MKTMFTLMTTAVIGFVSIWSAMAGEQQNSHATLAQRLLKESGVAGGLVVHCRCGDGKLTAALAANDSYLVHGLSPDAAGVAAARRHVELLDLYGTVFIEQWSGGRLPYADDLVNLLLVTSGLSQTSREEIERVLCPGGVALTLDPETGNLTPETLFRKPWPREMDAWTHYMHDATGNPVSQDTVVGPPRRLQWIGEPKWDRSHEEMASLSAMVSSGKRIFYIMDEGPTASIRLMPKWMLVARDAFNGIVLWKRPIDRWHSHLYGFRSGPAHLPLRLVAAGDRVFVTLGIDAAVTALDAATGETLMTYAGTDGTQQILHSDDKLVMLVGATRIVAADADSGQILWQKEVEAPPYPTIAVCGDKIVYQTRQGVHCLDGESGRQLWEAANPMNVGKAGGRPSWELPALVVTDEIAYSADFATLRAVSMADGRELWSAKTRAYFHSRPFVAVIDDTVWTNLTGSTRLSITGHHCRTGEVQKTVEPPEDLYPSLGHARCYLPKATTRFLLSARSGTEFVDFSTGEMRLHHWVRGTCQYGVMPAEGLLYAPPHSCACEMRMKLEGFYALAPEGSTNDKGQRGGDERLGRGPAYDTEANLKSEIDNLKPEDWPTYRADAARGGAAKTAISADLDIAWQAEVGGKLSGITVAGGKVFVASVDAHSVHALDIDSGRCVWRFTANGRVDSPPTIHAQLVLFGSADGFVYCVRASDGELVWRFRAAPRERRVVVRGQLESAWPVHGSVLVQGGEAVVTAGRSSYLDGGIHVYRLDPATGKMISETVVYSPDPETHIQPTSTRPQRLSGAKSDILSSDGESVYMRHLKLDFEQGGDTQLGPHLYCPTGFLDDTWWHRSYWLFAREFLLGFGQPSCPGNGWNDWWNLGNVVPSGRIMVYDDDYFYGYGRNTYPGYMGGQWKSGEAYHLFASPRSAAELDDEQLRARVKQMRTKKGTHADIEYRWTATVPMSVRAMALADQTLLIAGPPDLEKPDSPRSRNLIDPDEAVAAFEGKHGALLWAVDAADGKRLNELKLDAMPVWDGMVAAQERVFLSTTDGKVLCLSGEDK